MADFPATVAGSLPKPFWLAEPNKLWAPWRMEGDDLARAKRDATILAVKLQEDAGLAIVSDGEQSRRHFVHGFLEFVEGIDFAHQVAMGIRKNRYTAMVPVVKDEIRLTGRVHADEARTARAHTRGKLKITMPGPMTIVDTIADEHYGDRTRLAFAFADLLNQEARALEADGVDTIQFDEPAFNVYMDEVKDWGIEALHRAIDGLTCTTAVHICYGYGIKANLEWKQSLGGVWTQYEEIFPALAASRLDQVSVEAMHSHVPLQLLSLLKGKDVLLGCIDVANETVETPEEVASLIEQATAFVPAERIFPCTNCGMAPMHWDLAYAKLERARRRRGAGARTAGLAGRPSDQVLADPRRGHERRRTRVKNTGTKKTPISVDDNMPPSTPMPMAFCAPEPAPVASASGSTPSMKASEVMMIGRIRMRAACRTPRPGPCPAPPGRVANSTIRIAFLAARPMVVSRPTLK